MAHRVLGFLAAGLCLASRERGAEDGSGGKRRRNVILVIADDLRPQFSYLGFEDVRALEGIPARGRAPRGTVADRRYKRRTSTASPPRG